MLLTMEKFVNSLTNYFNPPIGIAIPMQVAGWGACSLYKLSPEEVKKLYGITVKNHYWFYVLESNGLVAISTALSTKHGPNDTDFINNYQQNFKKHPHGDIEFSFMSNNISFGGVQAELNPFIYVYAPNIYQAYKVVMQSPYSDKTGALNQLYTPMFIQWIEYIERVSNEITKPYLRNSQPIEKVPNSTASVTKAVEGTSRSVESINRDKDTTSQTQVKSFSSKHILNKIKSFFGR